MNSDVAGSKIRIVGWKYIMSSEMAARREKN